MSTSSPERLSGSDEKRVQEARGDTSEDSPSIDEPEEIIRGSPSSSESYIASEDEDMPPKISHSRFSPSSKSNKRRAESPSGPRTREKILKHYYSEEYRELFNASLAEFGSGTGFGDSDPINSANTDDELGIVKWTCLEKGLFFDALSRFGRGSVRGIAAHIGTKSETEVDEYMQLLHQGLVESYLQGPHKSELHLKDYPAVHEIGKECRKALERAADALALHQEEYEYNIERELHGDYWLVNSSVAEWTIDQISKGDEGVNEVSRVLPAAILLNPLEWISLSENVFMNTGLPNLNSNWRSLAFDDETPSLTHTAFSDFHTLAVSVTKRIVQTAIFCAESRLKSTSNEHHERGRNVRNRDITAALEILRMKHTRFDFWIGAARRNNVEVQERARKETLTGRVVSFEEVEKTLTEPVKRIRGKKNGDEMPLDTDNSTPTPVPDNPKRNSHGGVRRTKAAPAPRPGLPKPLLQVSPSSLTPSPPPSPSTAHAQLQDLNASRAHESYLWTDVLKQKPPTHLDLSISLPNLSGKEPKKRKSRDVLEHMNWRDSIRRVGAEWEAMGDVVSKEEFEEMRRRGQQNFESRMREGDENDDEDNEIIGSGSEDEGSDEDVGQGMNVESDASTADG